MEEHAVAPCDPSRDDCVWNLLTNPKSKPITRTYEAREWKGAKSATVIWKGYEATCAGKDPVRETSVAKLSKRLGIRGRGQLFAMDFGELRRVSIGNSVWMVRRIREMVRR